jgi:hypothetical protein
MNPCIKTGCLFQVMETGARYWGDLFYDGREWQVRGFVPRDAGCGEPDIVVSNATIIQRPTSEYADTNNGIVIESTSPKFREFMREWNPEVVYQ